MRGGADGFLGLAAWAAGDVEEALATFSEAVRSLHAAGNLVDELDARCACRHVGGRGTTQPRPPALRAGARDGDRTAASRTRGRPPTCTSAWPSSTWSSTTSPARRRTWRRRGSWPSEPPSPRTGTGGPSSWRQVRAARGDHDAAIRLLEEAAALYRHGFYPDVRPIAATKARVQISTGDLDAGSGVGAGARAGPRRRPGLPARVRAPHPGPAALGPEPQQPSASTGAQLRPARRLFTRCSAGCTMRPPTPVVTAACWRSGCCRPSPTPPTATATRRSVSSLWR